MGTNAILYNFITISCTYLFCRPIHFRGNSADSTLTEASEVVSRPKRISPRKKVAAKIRGNGAAAATGNGSQQQQPPQPQKLDNLQGGQELCLTEKEISTFLHPTLDELRKSFKLQKKEVDLSEAVMKVVVGYLGTIEMPKENQVSKKVTCGNSEVISRNFENKCIF